MCTLNPSPADTTEEHVMPCAEAMLAGTLALMTGYAQQGDAGVRSLMARKVVSNLFFLAGHPHLSDAFRTMLGNLRAHWQAEVSKAGQPAALDLRPAAPQHLWHATPVAVQ